MHDERTTAIITFTNYYVKSGHYSEMTMQCTVSPVVYYHATAIVCQQELRDSPPRAVRLSQYKSSIATQKQ
jgi:hypothetical protein